jgi:hypothetical protein
MSTNEYYNPRANEIFNWMYREKDDPLQIKRRQLLEKQKKNPAEKEAIQGEIDLINAEINADTTHQQQQLMKIAAEAGASGGGTAVSHGGPRMPYGDTAMFNPKAMPQRYIPGTKPREEDELIPPGLFSPYRMYR